MWEDCTDESDEDARRGRTYHGELMEHPLSLWHEEVPDDDDEVGQEHHGEHGPEPVGAMGGDVSDADPVGRVGLPGDQVSGRSFTTIVKPKQEMGRIGRRTGYWR